MFRSLRRLGDAGRIGRSIRTRTHATAIATAAGSKISSAPSSSTCYVSERLRAKNVLRALADLLPRILEPSLLEREGWPERISNAVERLDAEPYQPSVAFWSPTSSSSKDLITALLEDPLSSDDARRSFLARRWEHHHDSPVLRISYNCTTTEAHSEIKVASSWLRNAEATIVELRDNDLQRVITHLFNADIVVLVFDSPAEMLSQSEALRPLLESSSEMCQGLRVIVNNPLCGTAQGKQVFIADSLAAILPADASHRTAHEPPIHFHAISSEAAIDAQAAFRRDQLQEALASSPSPAYAEAVNRFQTSLDLSGLPRLSEGLLESLGGFCDNNHAASPTGRRFSMNTVSAAVHRARRSIRSAIEEVKDARNRTKQLSIQSRTQIREFKQNLFKEGDLVSLSTHPSRKGVESYLDALKWWKLPWRVDELASDVANIMNSTYARDLERKLVYQTGRLVSFQASLDSSVLAAVTYPSTSSLHSPLLLNSLEQLDVQKSRRLSPTSLLNPIERRLTQMIKISASPLAHLHLRAQIILLQAYSLSIGGPAVAWGGWAVGFAGEELAIGAGTLSFALGLRWAVGRWEKAKRKWWESWDRVEEGLERDIKHEFDNIVEDIILAKTSRAVDGLERVITRRAEQVGEVSSELETIWRDALELDSRRKMSTKNPPN